MKPFTIDTNNLTLIKKSTVSKIIQLRDNQREKAPSNKTPEKYEE